MPWFSMPPGRTCFSSTVTAWPQRASSRATVRPATPPPTTATRLPVGWSNSGGRVTGSPAKKSAAARLLKQMASGSPCAVPAVPAGRFAGPRTDAAQDGRKDIVLQIDLVGRVEIAAGDGRQVFGYPRMGRAGRLAGDDGLDPLHVARRLARLPSGAKILFRPGASVMAAFGGERSRRWQSPRRNLQTRARTRLPDRFHLSAMAAVGHASTHSRAARCRAADMASSSGAVTRTSNPRPTKASPNGSPAFSATRRQFPQRIHLPGS